MNIQDLRRQYKSLTPKERAELFFAKSIPFKDDNLADALEPDNIFDNRKKLIAETRMLMLGSLWLNRICWGHGIRMGAFYAQKRLGKKIRDFEEFIELMNSGPAMGVALDRFDKEQGGWLRGVAAIMDCQKFWDNMLELGTFMSQMELSPFRQEVDNCYNTIKSQWDEIKKVTAEIS